MVGRNQSEAPTATVQQPRSGLGRELPNPPSLNRRSDNAPARRWPRPRQPGPGNPVPGDDASLFRRCGVVEPSTAPLRSVPLYNVIAMERSVFRSRLPAPASRLLCRVLGAAVLFTLLFARGAGAVEDIRVERSDAEATVIAIDVSARIPLRSYRLSGPSRHVLRFIGIPQDIAPHLVEVGDDRVIRVRVGHHPEHDPPELHVVIDLADDGIEVVRTSRGPATVWLTLMRTRPVQTTETPPAPRPSPPSTTTPRPVAPTPITRIPAPSPSPPIAPAPPSPAATATVTAPPQASRVVPATPTATPTGHATPTATETEQTAPPTTDLTTNPLIRQPPISVTPHNTPLPTPSSIDAAPPAVTSPAEQPNAEVLGTLLQVKVSCRADGTTLLRVSTDTSIDDSAMEYLQAIEDATRHVLLLEGYPDPMAPRTVPVCGEIIRSLEVVPDPMFPQRSTRVVIQLADPVYDVVRGVAKGQHLVLEFAATTSEPTAGQ